MRSITMGMAVAIWLAGAALVGARAEAALIEGSTTGIFENPVLESNGYVTGVGTNLFRWGETSRCSDCGPSALKFYGKDISVETGEVFSLGTLKFWNGQILLNTGATGVDFELHLALTSPGLVSQDFSYTLELINTPNTGTKWQNADYVIFPTSLAGDLFTVDGLPCTLEFLGFGYATEGGYCTIDEFHVFECCCACAQLLARIECEGGGTPPPDVPEPGVMGLLALGGLVTALGVKRRSQKE